MKTILEIWFSLKVKNMWLNFLSFYCRPYSRMRERRTFNSLTMEGVRPHDSVLSGYDGDKEDADESFIEEEGKKT